MLNKLKLQKFRGFVVALLLAAILMPSNVYAFQSFAPWWLSEPVVSQPVEPEFFWHSEMLLTRQLGTRIEGLDIRGSLPTISPAYPAAASLNEMILNAERTFINNARRLRARYITFSYEVQTTGELVSVIVYANVESAISRAFVQSINFNHRTGNIMNLTDATNMEIAPLLDRILNDMIRRNPERYYAAMRQPVVPQAFYKNATHLVLLFDEFKLTTFAGGVSRIELSLNNLITFTMSPHEFRSHTTGYDVKMMPLRYILEARLGYEVRWVSETRMIQVLRDGQLIVKMLPGHNLYQVLGVGAQIRSLEAAPEYVGGDTIYVPITFFDQILSMTTYSIDGQGNVTFLAYRP